ncbi:MAG: hypothetical protein KatS3mg044_0509 [Rhodothermaceae bacterium]|nr:MAG: hypothetical protein KatS3mg044_0509 [Rhodothermaceae bacterium]
MNTRLWLTRTVITLSLFVLTTGVSPAQTRSTLRNDFGIELLGKGYIYTFSYQHLIHPSIGLQASLMGLGGNGGGILILPVGGNLYVSPNDASPFFTVGIGYVSGIDDDDFIGSGSYVYVGPGFEYRSTSGLLFRATGYLLFAGDGFITWPGLHVGYAF